MPAKKLHNAADEKTADNLLDVPGEDVFDLLRAGQRVDTPLGEGVIVDIALQAGRYGDRIELEPPAITVRLDDPPEDVPKEIVVCMCKLGLDDPKLEAIIRKEFGRLWPPITDDVPEDIHMLMDLNKKDELEQVRSRFERNVTAKTRNASATIRKARQRRAYQDYAYLAVHLAEPVIDEVSSLDSGYVLNGLEDTDLGGELGVVLDALKQQGGEDGDDVFVLLYRPDSGTFQHLSLPGDLKFMGHDGAEATGYSPTVYDPLRVDSPELHPIRILPNSYLPKSPNYPSSITDTVWRPTVRQTPIRFYETKKDAGFERRPDGDRPRPWPPTDYVNYPTPDTVNPADKTKPKKRGKQAFDPMDQELEIEPMENKKMEELATKFWASYQQYREQKLPGGPSTIDFDLLDFADIFAGRHELDDDEMLALFNYMSQIGIFDEYLVHKYRMHQNEKFTQKNLRTHF